MTTFEEIWENNKPDFPIEMLEPLTGKQEIALEEYFKELTPRIKQTLKDWLNQKRLEYFPKNLLDNPKRYGKTTIDMLLEELAK